MAQRSGSSARWLREHREDPYVAAARRDGYRSRAAYKLLELQETAARGGNPGIIRAGMTVVDLGAAPGGWTQVAVKLVGTGGRVVAVDQLAMGPVPGAEVLTGDFLDDAVLAQLRAALAPSDRSHVVLSDLAPNLTGIRVVDQARGMLLAEAALQFAETALRPGGRLVVKLFQGEGFQELVRHAGRLFARVKVAKPRSSRGRSREHYLLGFDFRENVAHASH